MTDTTSTTTDADTGADTGVPAAAGPEVAAPAAQGPRMEQIDPSLLLVDRNVRRDAAPDKTLIESVRDLGVLVPIVAVRTETGIRVRYGHRRTHAAIQAGQPTVPVWVFDTDHADRDTDRIVAQWAENEHRAALTDTDRLAAVEQLSAFGVTAAQITRRLKTKRTQVDAALAVAASPLAKKATERYEFLTLDQAAVLAEFDAGDDADTLKALVLAAKDSPGQFAHVAQRARDDRAACAREQAARDAIAASGVTVLSGRAPSRYGPAGGPGRLLADLTDPDGEPLTPAGHATCPGHAAHLAVEYGHWTDEQAGTVRLADTDGQPAGEALGYDVDDEGYESNGEDDGDGRDAEDNPEGEDNRERVPWSPRYAAAYVCTDYPAHGHLLRWSAQTGRPQAAPASDTEAAEHKETARAERKRVIENNKAWTSAETVRREWLTALLTRKTAPKGTAVFIAASLARCPHALTQALTGSHRLAGVLLGCPKQAAGYGRGAAGVLGLLDGASERRAEVVTLALVLAAYEDATGKHSWRHADPATARYLQFLTDAGYTPSAVERLASGEQPPAGEVG